MTQSILTHPSEFELVDAVHENLYALFRSFQILPGCELVENEKFSLHHASPSNSMFKGAWRTRHAPEEVEGAIDETIAWFDERGAPYFFWWTDPKTNPEDLNERLVSRGFDGNMIGDPGMVADLYSLNEDVQVPNGFIVRQALEKGMLEHWRDVFVRSFNVPDSIGQAWVDATIMAGQEQAPWKMYVGYLHEKPVATSIIFNGAGVVGVYSVGTLPEVRLRGIGSVITLQPMLEARQEGYFYAVLFSSRMGYPVYKRLGFREVESKIGIFILEKD